MESHQNINILRKACKHLMIDLDLERNSESYSQILPRLSEKMGQSINVGSLIMALTGFREGPAYQNLLSNLHDLLKNWPQKAA
jgi:hypothetical protein